MASRVRRMSKKRPGSGAGSVGTSDFLQHLQVEIMGREVRILPQQMAANQPYRQLAGVEHQPDASAGRAAAKQSHLLQVHRIEAIDRRPCYLNPR